MGRSKLEKFADLHLYSNVLEVDYKDIKQENHPLRGKWNTDFFKNNNPIVLELGCGKGEYTTSLAELYPSKNYLGIDIKGNRMWDGATYALKNNLQNVGFLRTHIELISQFFAPNEVSEIWLTFPDPQLLKTRKRLTSTRFINYYRKFLSKTGIIHLKTDSNFMYQYTLAMAKTNNFKIVANNNNIYSEVEIDATLQIRTYYEQQWINRGLKIKYLSFVPHQNKLSEPDIDIEPDTYRSYGRGKANGE